MSLRYVPIAEITRPHGVRGELRLKLYNEESGLIAKGRRVFLLPPAAVAQKGRPAPTKPDLATITSVRAMPGALLVRLQGVDDRDAADNLRGTEIAVDRDDLPDLPDGEFYACDLEGARVELVSGDVIGKVLELQSYPTCDVLRVQLDEGRVIEVPLVDSYVAQVDADAHFVKLHHIGEL